MIRCCCCLVQMHGSLAVACTVVPYLQRLKALQVRYDCAGNGKTSMHLNEAAAAANHRIVSLNQRRRAFAQLFPPNLSIHSIGCFFSNKRCLDTNNTISTLPPRKTSQFRFLKHMRKLL